MGKRVISFHYTLTDPSGKTLDSSKGESPMSFLEGVGQIIPGLEEAVQNLKVGDKKKIRIPSARAYGARSDDRVIQVSREKLGKQDVKVGDRFKAEEHSHAPPLVAVKVTKSHITLDGNHPLAGVDLTFDVEVTEIRDATEEELAHGHAHGGSCCH